MLFDVSIRHDFGRFELDVSLKGQPGVTALFGPSGAGKTSVIRAVAGLLHPDKGHVRLAGRTLLDTGARINLPAHQRRMGYVFQDGRLFPHLSVLQNLRFARAQPSPGLSEADLVSLLGIEALLERAPNTLSGGERQRVALARALLARPDMLLMDEPLASLDDPRKDDVLPYLNALKRETGLPILYVTHSVDELARLADQIVVLNAGKVVTSGSVFDILASPVAMPFLGVREAGSVLRAEVGENLQDGLTQLKTSAGLLEVPELVAPKGEAVRLRILARDIILATQRPHGISARNVLNVRIESIEKGRGPGMAVVLRAGQETLLARITARSCAELQLAAGQSVYAILKATAVSRIAVGA